MKTSIMQFPKSNFSEWFTDVLAEAGIVDMRYPVKGMPVYMPWGFAILRNIFSELERLQESTGHQQAMFPLLAPEDLLARESHMLEGFSPQVFWVEEEQSGVQGLGSRVQSLGSRVQSLESGVWSSEDVKTGLLFSQKRDANFANGKMAPHARSAFGPLGREKVKEYEGAWGNQNERVHAKQPSALRFPQRQDVKTGRPQNPRPETRDPRPRRLAIRPTSETIMYTMYSLWVRSYKDLPLKIHQTVAIYRNETRATRPLIRGREIYWNEAHTVHATKEDAERQVQQGIEIYSQIYAMLGVSFITVRRPDFDRFPGAEYSIAFDTLLPDGKSLQIATVHYLGTNFSKAYGINYKNEKNESVPAHQVTYGISMRALAAVIAAHGDDKGLVLPSGVAPVQAVIVPFVAPDAPDVKMLVEKLKSLGLRCKVDARDKRPGEKFYYWEARGVPLRIELGKQELDGKKMKAALRTGEKILVPLSSVDEIAKLLAKQDESLASAHGKYVEANTYDAKSLNDLTKTGFAKVGWCGSIECAEKLKETGMEIRGTLYGEAAKEKRCIVCGKDGKEVYAGHPY